MYTIGEFAAIGRISVRMLRHYDAIGLLPPARVDERSGYRFYSDAQLADLLRVVELRQLGVGLDAIAAVLASDDQRPALAAVLRQRRTELRAGIAEGRIEAESGNPQGAIRARERAARHDPEYLPVILPALLENYAKVGERTGAPSPR